MSLKRLHLRLEPDARRVVVRPFNISAEPRNLMPTDLPRAQRIVDRVLSLTPDEIAAQKEAVLRAFHQRHRTLDRVIATRIEQIGPLLERFADANEQTKWVIAAHFCHEYSFEAAALFNPSIIMHFDQPWSMTGKVRFIMSVRAVGEGHISSVVFRTGAWRPGGGVELDPPQDCSEVAQSADPHTQYAQDGSARVFRQRETPLGELVIFPMTPAQRNGIEDMRLTEFTDENGVKTYYGTYTAYSGSGISPGLMITPDFYNFSLHPLTGTAALNKGMALFPRRIGGAYAMLTRIDNESLFFVQSDDILRWDNAVRVMGPKYPWEFIQIGNCGAPIELDEGWLVLTHAVSAMRQYALGACLLDKDDPTKVLARSPLPIMSPQEDEREGYVPNVVYTCGGLKAGKHLLIPYGISDRMVGFATCSIAELLALME
ncbi:MAG: glycoside hydrolase family 130 protein [Parvularculaceae bacterium]